QLEALAVLVLAFDFLSLLADAQVADLEQRRLRPVRDRLTAELHVAVFLGGLLEDGLDLLHGLAAVLLQQARDVPLAVERPELLRQGRLLPARAEPLQA